MNYYENIVILNAALDDEGVDIAERKITETIEKSAGQMLNVERWGRRKLAYIINKQEKGYYILFVFKAPSGTIKSLENFFKVNDNIFKFMVIKLGKKEIKALEKSLETSKSASAASKVESENVVSESAEEIVPENTPKEVNS
ncbi:MAG: 30S ribosomal protein S6 [Candidatus Magnetoovum sp. WYHC-5]|nr:30S ribosomal protein S6 [Candidatus Magnetoovum sp. WYHC-5]